MTRLLITLAFPPDLGGMQSFAYARALAKPDIVVLAPRMPGWQEFDARQPFETWRWPVGRSGRINRLGQVIFPLVEAWRPVPRGGVDAGGGWPPPPNPPA